MVNTRKRKSLLVLNENSLDDASENEESPVEDDEKDSLIVALKMRIKELEMMVDSLKTDLLREKDILNELLYSRRKYGIPPSSQDSLELTPDQQNPSSPINPGDGLSNSFMAEDNSQLSSPVSQLLTPGQQFPQTPTDGFDSESHTADADLLDSSRNKDDRDTINLNLCMPKKFTN